MSNSKTKVGKVQKIFNQLDQSLSAVKVTGRALRGGETDLELQAADVLEAAGEELQLAYEAVLLLKPTDLESRV